MNAGPLTLRELTWMAKARRQHDGLLIGWELGHVIGVVTGEWLDVQRLNPFAEHEPEPIKTEAQREREHRAGWDMIDRVWGGQTVARIKAKQT